MFESFLDEIEACKETAVLKRHKEKYSKSSVR